MDFVHSILFAAFFGIIILTIVRIFSIPIRRIAVWIINTIFGFALLALFDRFGTYLPFTLGFNLFNAAVIGVLGIPGIILLILIKWLFAVP